jgi:DNA modification methylase
MGGGAVSMIQENYKLFHGKMEDVLGVFPGECIDSCVTDPPYGIGFMGKEWDTFKNGYRSDNWHGYDSQPKTGPSLHAGKYDRSYSGSMRFQKWFYDRAKAVYRVLKPGGYFIVFCSPRTYHRVACAIEDAGFEIRDQIMWVFGSGFPKSHNLDGAWNGWGTALKPAHEPIVVARKPLIGTVKANVEKYGTGAMNIDECRVEGEPWKWGSQTDIRGGNYNTNKPSNGKVLAKNVEGGQEGRWPANFIHDGSEGVLDGFPITKSGDWTGNRNTPKTKNTFGCFEGYKETPRTGDEGSASRFFYCAKTSPEDRNEGCGNNNHPTVKPTELMRYMCRLFTPKGGLILDPFCGSGSTGKAAMYEHFRFVGIDMDDQYITIADKRIKFAVNNRDNQMKMFD